MALSFLYGFQQKGVLLGSGHKDSQSEANSGVPRIHFATLTCENSSSAFPTRVTASNRARFTPATTKASCIEAG